MKTVHLMQAVHAAKLFEKGACYAKGTKQVVTSIDDVTCPKCKHWYWHCEGLVVAQHVVEELSGAPYEVDPRRNEEPA